LDRFARIVLGYHGCKPEFSDDLISGKTSIQTWEPSRNPYDWLGHGIYFWEHAPERARDWGDGGVVGAIIQLGSCLDLTDIRYTQLLGTHYQFIKNNYKRKGLVLPKNHGKGGKLRDLDCLVINELIASLEVNSGIRFQTVRSPFLEGQPAFRGSGILRESHIQIAVRDRECILGIFRPNLKERSRRDA
jgi:hypothetical protein